MKHIMLDLEAFSTLPTAAVCSIGAAYFDPLTGKIGPTFKSNITFSSCVEYGLHVDCNTLNWWSRQSDLAQLGLTDPAPVDLKYALAEFEQWILAEHRNPFVWGNGVLFDNAIIRNAFMRVGMKCPWHYRNDRDVRTLVALAGAFGKTKQDNSRQGKLVRHDALGDALYQVQYVSAIWQALTKRAIKGGLYL